MHEYRIQKCFPSHAFTKNPEYGGGDHFFYLACERHTLRFFHELDDQVIIVDVEGDESSEGSLHAWKEQLIPRIREEQKKYVWIAHDNSDVVLPVESLKHATGQIKSPRASTATRALTMI